MLNFTRMGDLIQCGPLLDRLRETDADPQLTLIALENFAETARRLPMVDEVIPFPLDRFIPRLDHHRLSLPDLYAELSDFAASLRARHFDRFYNLAHTRLSAALTWLVRAPETHGMTYDSSGHLLITNPWINYYFYVTLDRTHNPFNLVEMYLPIGESGASQPRLRFRLLPNDEREAAGLLSTRVGRANGPCIAFQMGAADERRRWPVAAFADLARQLIAHRGATIALLGTAEDIPRSRALIDTVGAEHVLDLTGKTHIGALAAVLAQCRVLISNDTGTIHLAAAVGIPTVGIYLGPAAAKDTGPYGDGHVVFEPRVPCAPCAYLSSCGHRVCHDAIRPSDVAEATVWQIENGHRADVARWDSSRVRVWHTRVTEDGQLRLVPMTKFPLERQTFLHSLYRIFWPLLLTDCYSRTVTPAEAWTREEAFLDEHYQSFDPVDLLTSDDAQAISIYERIAERAQSAVAVLEGELTSSRPSLSVLRDGALELAECDSQLAQVEETFPAWAPLAQFTRVVRGNVPDDSPAGLATACHEVYGTLIRGSRILRALWQEVTRRQTQEVRSLHA